MQENEKQGVFLNGKQQIIEMLQFMQPDEKARLLQNMRLKNPAMADELAQKSISFYQVEHLSNHEIMLILSNVSSTIMGLALKEAPVSMQKKVLSLAPRDYAENAYSIMMSQISADKSRKGVEKVKAVLVNLKRKRQITTF